MEAEEVIVRYGLAPHPEGGHYRETYRALAPDGGRGAVTAILPFESRRGLGLAPDRCGGDLALLRR